MKTEQIKAMLETGFTKPQVKLFLGVSDEEIANATEEKPKEEPKAEEPETHKLKRVGRNGTKINEESFKLIRQDLENGVKRGEIFEKYGIANALYYKIKKSPTFKDFCDLRKIETNKKQEQPERSSKFGDGEYRTRKRDPKYTEELWNEGKKMHDLGVPYREIAARQGFSVNFVAKVLRLPTYDALAKERKKERDKRKEDFERTKAMVKAEAELDMQLSEEELKQEEPKVEAEPVISKELIEYRSMADSLARIADALEKIATKKRGLFRK